LTLLKSHCESLNLRNTLISINRTINRLTGNNQSGDCNIQIIQTELQCIRESLLTDLGVEKFIHLRPDAHEYFEQDALFGDEVRVKFPSAAADIKAAGNCLALDLWTAAVFHLMRVVEYGLRALARERKIKLPKKRELEWAEWQEIISGIDQKVALIRQWSRGSVKDKALAFYCGAIGEFYAFKDVYRNHVMHTRESYDLHQAASVIQHVSEFMKRLAAKIDEKPAKSIKWK
jgi:hypothetical protein